MLAEFVIIVAIVVACFTAISWLVKEIIEGLDND